MIVAIPKENDHLEHRVAATPGSVKDLTKSGMKAVSYTHLRAHET